MADIDEDAPVTSLHTQSYEDNDPSDETQDFRLLLSLTSKPGQKIPKRGEKDFEPHGTKHQDGILAASREAMHDALDYTRVHMPKSHIRGFYYGEEGMRRDDAVDEEWRQGLDDDHVVVVDSWKGPHFRSIGKTTLGKPNPSLWLLPEEALYLVERGNLDLWWPTRSSIRCILGDEGDDVINDDENLEEKDEGVPLSLQAAYSLLIGEDGARGKVSLERYTVYSNLKRTGYVVFKAPEYNPIISGKEQGYQAIQEPAANIFTWLFGRLFAKEIEHAKFGPLVKPGMYRSYDSIYQQIAIIPRHKPSAIPTGLSPSSENPFRVVYLLWKASRIPTFAKSNPGNPDFRVAIADARSSSVPSLVQMTSLLESTPWDPPTPMMKDPSKVYQRLKHGLRNVVLAVIDRGIISYVRLGEAAFGEEKLYERFDQGSAQGTKRGGGGGGGHGRGGRGRGGRGRGSGGGQK
jgi:tRNA-splicing endonuclease subunit Sen54